MSTFTQHYLSAKLFQNSLWFAFYNLMMCHCTVEVKPSKIMDCTGADSLFVDDVKTGEDDVITGQGDVIASLFNGKSCQQPAACWKYYFEITIGI